jgi:HSP20 family molecular chaperone IbpA
MYVVLILMFAAVFWAGKILGQQSSRPVDDRDDLMEKRMKMREEMHRRMMDKLLRGIGPDQDMFSDMEEMMNDLMKDSFTGFDSLAPDSSNFEMAWSESTSGRTLEITPAGQDKNLDINVSNGLIIIKGKIERKSSQGVSVSNFTNSFNVPDDCDPSKVKMEQKSGKIFVHFPFRTSRVIELKSKERKPLPPSKEDVQI